MSSAPTPTIARSRDALRQMRDQWRAKRAVIALVPTMGALHDGHLSLVDVARAKIGADGKVLASIFVNPAQFGPDEDFDAYPRDEARDLEMLAARGVDAVYMPPVDEIYSAGFATRIIVDELTGCLCGAARPGHFDGVATVVAKLFNQTRPDYAVFGEKDYQQLLVIRRMSRDLDLDVGILSAPILREQDGLAMSSRNAYLDAGQREIAGRLNTVLKETATRLASGDTVGAALGDAHARLREAGVTRVDYLDVRHARTLAPVNLRVPEDGTARLFAAIFIGKTRLIDNVPVETADNRPDA